MRRDYMNGEEFLERQSCFDFGRVARAVVPILVKLRKDLRAWEKPARIARAKLSTYILPLFELAAVTKTRRAGPAGASA